MKRLLILLLALSPAAFATAAFVASNTAGCANSCTATTTSTNCTGANLLVANANAFVADPSAGTMSDSTSANTWHHLTVVNDSGGSGIETVIWYAWNASVSSTQTFSFQSTSFPGIVVHCYSGAQSSSDPFDVQNGTINAAGTTAQPGSITPGANGEVVFTGITSFNGSDTYSSIDSSFTISGNFQYNGNMNMAGAYLIQGTAGAVNPTWTATQSVKHMVAIASFKAAAGGGGATPTGSKMKKLLKLDASNMPSFCSGMATPDCDGFTSGTEVSVACLFADGACGGATMPVNLLGGLFGGNSQALTASGAVTAGQHTCLVGGNLASAPIPMGSLGSVDANSFAYSCTQ